LIIIHLVQRGVACVYTVKYVFRLTVIAKRLLGSVFLGRDPLTSLPWCLNLVRVLFVNFHLLLDTMKHSPSLTLLRLILSSFRSLISHRLITCYKYDLC